MATEENKKFVIPTEDGEKEVSEEEYNEYLKAEKERKKREKRKAKKDKVGGVMNEFKTFINRGKALDMSIGVVIGGAFGAIVTAVTNILLSICMWAVPGGLSGLISVLPPLGPAQEGMKFGTETIQSFNTSDLQNLINQLVGTGGIADANAARSQIMAHYTLYGSTYVYNGAAIINWGAVINAIISFLIIALILFLIIKIVAKISKANAEAKAKAREAYYKKHPEERPVPPEPGVPEPTEKDILKDILLTLKKLEKTGPGKDIKQKE